MVNFTLKEKYSIDDLLHIMRLLRSPDGCPWDREQTHRSIRRNFIEEVYEACEAIDLEDDALLIEELGDVLLQIVFHAEMAREERRFDFDDVADGICKKLIVRHPHIFGGLKLETDGAEEVLKNWEAIKNKTKNHTSHTESLEAVAKSLPALMRAEKVQSRAKRAGMDWDGVAPVMDKLREETQELAEAAEGRGDAFAELGDVLFTAVNIARHMGIDPEEALGASTERFVARFRAVEKRCEKDGVNMAEAGLPVLDKFWEDAKDGEKKAK
ncbi:MAG: nucleoside triphosphate pyrophosphohydrolase [Clostridiales bacterium]|nr:MAG: nucleoside triphosphate pyrophosphohydrolase [Clostridiales bacterium]